MRRAGRRGWIRQDLPNARRRHAETRSRKEGHHLHQRRRPAPCRGAARRHHDIPCSTAASPAPPPRAYAASARATRCIRRRSGARAGLPLRIEFIETPEKVEEVLPTLHEMVVDGLIEVQDTFVVKAARKSPKSEPKLPHQKKQGPAKLLRVFLGEADRWHGAPLYDAIVKKLRMLEIAGATVYRGILGQGAKGHEHRRSFFHPTRDLPVMISVIRRAAQDRGRCRGHRARCSTTALSSSPTSKWSGCSAAAPRWRNPMRETQPAKLLRIRHIRQRPVALAGHCTRPSSRPAAAS